jgi:hypothetical protein
LTITEAALGPDHPTVAIHLGNLAGSYSDLGQTADAVTLCRKAVQIANRALPAGHPTAGALQTFLEQLQLEAADEGRSE